MAAINITIDLEVNCGERIASVRVVVQRVRNVMKKVYNNE
jgi:hypothetical protein